MIILLISAKKSIMILYFTISINQNFVNNYSFITSMYITNFLYSIILHKRKGFSIEIIIL